MLTRAIVRGISDSYQNATVETPNEHPIDVDLARQQHSRYVETLRALGLEIIEVPQDPRFPDCCFVEDCALFHNGVALLTNPGEPSRRGEVRAVRFCLEKYAATESMEGPATMDGGDCLRINNQIYIGLSSRTNLAGIERARQVFGPLGLQIVPVEVRGALHLKSVCSYLGNRKMVLAENSVPASTFNNIEIIMIPPEEAYAANCLSVNGTVICSAGYPKTEAAVKLAGFQTVPLSMTEIKKGDGSLTCLSILS